MKLKSVVPESGRHYFVALPAVFFNGILAMSRSYGFGKNSFGE